MECREAVQLDGQHAAVGLAKSAEALADANRQRDETLADWAPRRPAATPTGRSWWASSRSRCSACVWSSC
jgi:hypothetical protein